MTQTPSLAEIFRAVPGLQSVEGLIATKFTTEAPQLAKIASYLFGLGGKRVRPALTLLLAKGFGIREPTQSLVDVAAGIELIHMATLLHDDIIDRSPIRRHHPSPYAEFGTNDTLLTGDFLLTRAFSLCARLDPFIIDATEEACINLTEGEILETPLYADTHSLSTSRIIAAKKTAALFRLGARSAGFLSGLRGDSLEALARFGEHLGVGFQMLDDILDVISPEETLGKRPGTDIRERKPSLINVLWLESNSPLATKLRKEPVENEEEFVQKALAELAESSVIGMARLLARQEVEAAELALHEAVGSASSQGIEICLDALGAIKATMRYTLERME